tara:strand:+ start:753 stop:1097 length:345 start_codon:yes stop_codon:yes gene_type:complete
MNLEKKLKKKINEYFLSFSKKNLDKLSNMFSDDIQIIDWTSRVKLKKNALSFNQKIFKKFKKIDVKLIEEFFNNKNNSFACKITIKLDDKKINVVDLIYFNSKLEIKKIIAFLG